MQTPHKTQSEPVSLLLIEDDKAQAVLVQRWLRRGRHTCDIAATGRQALRLAARNRYDAILCDVQLPDLGGMDVVARIRDTSPDVPIALLTAHASPDVAEQAALVSADRLLVKPLQRWQLLNTVKQLTGAGTLRTAGQRYATTGQRQFLSQFSDPRTGLANRKLLTLHLESTTRLADANKVVLMSIRLDHQAELVAALGQRTIDGVMAQMAEAIAPLAAPDMPVARLSDVSLGFAAIATDSGHAASIAERLRKTLDRVWEVDSLRVSASVGIGWAGFSGPRVDTWIEQTETAAAQACSEGAGRICGHSGEVTQRHERFVALAAALRDEWQTAAVEVHYQPLVDLEQGGVAGYEALLRWTRPNGERVSPAEFIPVAERTGLIRELGRRVLREACAGIAVLRQESGQDLHVSVNASALQLKPELVSDARDALSRSGIPASALWVEVTESALIDDVEAAHAVLGGLQSIGVKIAIDDFGTGYSNLGQLADMPADVLKVDRSFVTRLSSRPDGEPLLRSVIGLGRALGLTLVVEGVETADESAVVRRLGARFGQGWHYGRPCDLERCLSALREA